MLGADCIGRVAEDLANHIDCDCIREDKSGLAGISVLRSTGPLAVEVNGTCLPGFGGWYCVCAKNAVPTMAPDWLTAVARLANAPVIAPRSLQTPRANRAACDGAPEAKKIEPTISPPSLLPKAETALAPAGTSSVVNLPLLIRNSPDFAAFV